jgi:hypothetical protein
MNDNQRICSTFKMLWDADPLFSGSQYIITGRDRRSAKGLLSGGQEIHTSDLIARFKSYRKRKYWVERNLPAHGFFDHYSEFLPEKPKASSGVIMISCSLCGKDHPPLAACDLEGEKIQEGGTFSNVGELVANLSGKMANPVKKYDPGRCPDCGEIHSPYFICRDALQKGSKSRKDPVGRAPNLP